MLRVAPGDLAAVVPPVASVGDGSRRVCAVSVGRSSAFVTFVLVVLAVG